MNEPASEKKTSQSSKQLPDFKKMIERVKDKNGVDSGDLDHYLSVFEEYECWDPYFELISQQLNSRSGSTEENYIRLAKVQNLYLEDIFSASKTCADFVKNFSVSFERFEYEILPQLIERDDFSAEATILQSISDVLPSSKDLISCLERLCMIYEKKIYNEEELAVTYETLLAKDKKNVKALRYFKLVYSQNQEWADVANLLQDLMKSVSHKQEKYRVAQELATVLLYQLHQPEDSLKVIKSCCSGSPLDTSAIEYDAYYELEKWDKCLEILKQRLSEKVSQELKSVYLYQSGKLYLQLNKLHEAEKNFIAAANASSGFLDPIEKLLNTSIEMEDWPNTLKWIALLKAKVLDPEHWERLDQAMKRLEGGMSDAGSQQ